MSVLEALAAGVPVVATSEVGSIEGVDRSIAAELQPGDVDAMASAITQMIEKLRTAPTQTRSLARAEAERRFAPDVVSSRSQAHWNSSSSKPAAALPDCAFTRHASEPLAASQHAARARPASDGPRRAATFDRRVSSALQRRASRPTGAIDLSSNLNEIHCLRRDHTRLAGRSSAARGRLSSRGRRRPGSHAHRLAHRADRRASRAEPAARELLAPLCTRAPQPGARAVFRQRGAQHGGCTAWHGTASHRSL